MDNRRKQGDGELSRGAGLGRIGRLSRADLPFKSGWRMRGKGEGAYVDNR